MVIHIFPTKYDKAYVPIGFYQTFKLLPIRQLKTMISHYCFHLHAIITAGVHIFQMFIGYLCLVVCNLLLLLNCLPVCLRMVYIINLNKVFVD